MTKTGIKAWPRCSEQTTTSYRAGSFLCPECGAPMRVVVPGFDLDEIPQNPLELWLSCSRYKDEDCRGRVKISANVTDIVEETDRSNPSPKVLLDEAIKRDQTE